MQNWYNKVIKNKGAGTNMQKSFVGTKPKGDIYKEEVYDPTTHIFLYERSTNYDWLI